MVLTVHLLMVGSIAASASWISHAHVQQTAPASESQAGTANLHSYNIPAGPLNTVLMRFLSESGLLLSGSAELAQGRNSPGVQGHFTPGAALGTLLAGTGLKAVRNAEGRYTLQLAESEVTTLLPLTVSTDSLKQGTAEEGYRVSNVSGIGLWNERSLRDTPYSISVVPSNLIENINAQNMGQIFKMNPLTQEPSIQNFTGTPSVTIRGFESINPIYDGIPSASGSTAASVIEIDRVEILSGTSGFLYGGGRVGGAVNYVTKNSTDVPLRRLTFGNYGGTQFYGHADIGGKFDDRGRFGYRANLLYQGGIPPSANQSIKKSPTLYWMAILPITSMRMSNIPIATTEKRQHNLGFL